MTTTAAEVCYHYNPYLSPCELHCERYGLYCMRWRGGGAGRGRRGARRRRRGQQHRQLQSPDGRGGGGGGVRRAGGGPARGLHDGRRPHGPLRPAGDGRDLLPPLRRPRPQQGNRLRAAGQHVGRPEARGRLRLGPDVALPRLGLRGPRRWHSNPHRSQWSARSERYGL